MSNLGNLYLQMSIFGNFADFSTFAHVWRIGYKLMQKKGKSKKKRKK